MFHPRLFIVSGPSGVGKSTIIRRVLQQEPGMRLSVSLTTRPKRPGEVEGTDYYFVTPQNFEAMIGEGEFLEWAKVYDHYYGTSRSHIEGILASNHHALLDLDTQGAMQIKERFSGMVLVFIKPPDMASLEARLRNRGSESPETLAKRMAWAEHELSFADQYDHVIVNDHIDDAVRAFLHVISAEKERSVPFLAIGNHEPALAEALPAEAVTGKAVRYALERIDREALVRTLNDEVRQALRQELEGLIRDRLAAVLERDLGRIVQETYRVFRGR